MKTYLNDWQYFNQWNEDIFGDASGEEVRLPHTNVETPFNCFDDKIYQFVCGYKRNLHLDELCGTYLLTFEAVAHYAEVYVNGQLVCTHACGYTAFTVDVTSQLVLGDNMIVVKADSRESLNQPPFGYVIDYLTYGGMYREVYLDHFVGAYVSDAFVITQPQQPLKIQAEISNPHGSLLQIDVLDGTEVVLHDECVVDNKTLLYSKDIKLQLWDLDNPKLYLLKLTLDGNVWQTSFGVRSVQFTDKGFFLNGKRVKLVGLNRHQCFPYVGYAMPESMQRRDARILKKQLCVNIVRTSHYPQSQYFLDECDKLGLLVFTEIPGWQHIGDKAWQQIAVENVKEMITQYRNHPSVIMWGVRINESQDNDSLYSLTNPLAAMLDPTRQTGGVRNFMHSHLLEDVYTYNDFNRDGATNRSKVCEDSAPYLVTEYNGHMFPTKSYDDFSHRCAHMLRYAKMLDDIYADQNICGAIGWCMFDYNTHKDFGSGDRICYHGVMDMFRNPKMAAGVFSAQGKTPFLQLCFTPDIGDYPEGNVGAMYCLTNADYIELYKGNTFIKKYTHSDSPFKNLSNPPILIDDLIGDRLTLEEGISPKYAQMIKQVLNEIWTATAVSDLSFKTKLKIKRIMRGTKLSIGQLVALHNKYRNNWGSAATALTVKAYKNGKLVEQKTVGSASKVEIKLQVSSNILHENSTYDVAAVNILAQDENGNPMPYLSKVVHLRTEGAICLIGERDIPLAGGASGAYIKTIGKKGKGTLFVDDLSVEFEII